LEKSSPAVRFGIFRSQAKLCCSSIVVPGAMPMPILSDQPLEPVDLEDPTLVRAWYLFLRPKCVNVCRRLRLSESEAAEGYQAVWCNILGAKTYDPQQPFWPYFKSAYLRYLWRQYREQLRHASEGEVPASVSNPGIDWRVTYEWFANCAWAHLSARQRAVVSMHLLLPAAVPAGVVPQPDDLVASDFIADWAESTPERALPSWHEIAGALQARDVACRVAYYRAREHMHECWLKLEH